MIYLRRLRSSDFSASQAVQVEHADAWKVYGVCRSQDLKSLLFLLRLQEEEWSQQDQKAAFGSLLKLLQRAQSGQPLKQLFDHRKCHYAVEFRRKNKDEKIWRLWVAGIVRLFFCYGPDKTILVAWAMRKREDKLSEGEKSELVSVFSTVLDALESGQARKLGE